VERGGRKGSRERGRAEKNYCGHPCFNYKCITKLAYRWKASHRKGRFVPNFTAFIFNTSLTPAYTTIFLITLSSEEYRSTPT